MQKKSQQKEDWIINIKSQLLKDPTRTLPEIDSSLSNLYDNLNDEYKEEIFKNPELVLYYIFSEITSSQGYTTAIQLKKNELEDDSSFITKEPESYYKNLKGQKKDMIFKRTSFFINNNKFGEENDNNNGEEENQDKKLNLFDIAGIPEERRLEFSEHSSSSNDGKSFKNNKKNNNNMKQRKITN